MSKEYCRYDLALADYKVLDKKTCRLVIAYSLSQPAIGKVEIVKFFNTYLPELSPNCEASLINTKFGYVSVFASLKKEVKPLSEKNTMVSVIANLRYIDKDMGKFWEVSKDAQNNPVLQQVVDEDIEKIVKERKRRMSLTANVSHITMSLVTAGVANVMAGDFVKFYYDNSYLKGKVSSVDKLLNKVTIQCPDRQAPLVLDINSVVKVLSKNPKFEEAKEKSEYNYYKEVFGPEYSDKLTHGKK